MIEMAYQWNRDKAAANLRKHGIDFAMQYPFSQIIWQLQFQMNALMKNGSSQLVWMLLQGFWLSSTHYGGMRFDLFLPVKQHGKSFSSMRRDSHGSRI
jgi:hypothetical protein